MWKVGERGGNVLDQNLKRNKRFAFLTPKSQELELDVREGKTGLARGSLDFVTDGMKGKKNWVKKDS